MGEEKRIIWSTKQPGISFRLGAGKIAIHRSTLEIIGYPEYYRFLLNLEQNQLAIQTCGIDDSGAHRLPEIKDGETCEISSKDMVRLLYRSNQWSQHKSYHIQGVAYPQQQTVSFNLNDAQEIKEVKRNNEARM